MKRDKGLKVNHYDPCVHRKNEALAPKAPPRKGPPRSQTPLESDAGAELVDLADSDGVYLRFNDIIVIYPPCVCLVSCRVCDIYIIIFL